ncbi:hypothetical protein C9374_007187 [Naegleria lovaniensis]|uniref:Myb-like domain-containing protein n=1 Tax=Naegleria lovaniensis TaxID=51637 RepID=A0AA88H6V4_NAELO|nr:uncharacterized protein C9374_007187 [Naegleria lovaniensis]KAG2393656.1 hypothetical protein C9374_007187 [Naegleria lovaniensis]
MSDYADLLGVDASAKKKSTLVDQILSPKSSTVLKGKQKDATHSLAITSTPLRSPSLETPRRQSAKRKIIQTTDKWRWKAFLNNARDDGTVLFHWTRVDDDDDEQVAPNYPFEILNKKTRVFSYDDDEYKEIIEPLHKNENWSREETDLLFSLCQQYDLRFMVIHDRFCTSELKTQHSPVPPRSVEDLKKRYYEISKALLQHRAKKRSIPNEKLKKHPLMAVEYDYDYETRRKQNLEMLYSRSSEAEKRENELREQLKKIEAIKKKRNEEEQQLIRQKQKEEKERLRLETIKTEKQRLLEEKLRLASTPAVLTTMEEIEEQDETEAEQEINKFDASLFANLTPGVYSRRELMNYDDYLYHATILTKLGFDVNTLMPTRRVHEAFETTVLPLLEKYISLFGKPNVDEYEYSDTTLLPAQEVPVAESSNASDSKKKRKKQSGSSEKESTQKKKKKK